MDLNKVILVGNIVRDANVGKASNGRQYAFFDVATNFLWKDKSGSSKKSADYHKVVAWGKLAELVSGFLKKGQKVYIDGRIRNRKFSDKEGNDRYVTEVVAEDLVVVSRKKNREELTAPQKSLDNEVEEYQTEIAEEMVAV